MFFKLLKYDLKSTGRWFLLLYVASFIVSLIVSFTLNYNQDMLPIYGEPNLWTVLLLMALVIILATMIIYSGVAIIVYFYKNIFGREGYLTLTLPVSLSTIILSKLASAVILTIITFVVFIIDLFVIIYRAMPPLSELINTLSTHDIPISSILLLILCYLAFCIYGILFYYMCVAIGQLFSNYRVLMIFASIFVLGILVNIINTLVGLPTSISPDTVITYGFTQNIILMIIESTIYSIIYYVVTHYIIAKHLNIQ